MNSGTDAVKTPSVTGAPKTNASSPYYGVGAIFLLYLLLMLSFVIIFGTHNFLSDHRSFRRYWFYTSSIPTFVVVCVILCQRPRLLLLSRWCPKWKDLWIGASVGLLMAVIVLFWVVSTGDADAYNLPRASFISIVFITPVLEEIIFRGAFLKSLQVRMPRAAAICLVVLLAAIAHPSFWIALPGQLLLSLVYVYLGDSIVGSITAHMAMNAFAFLPIAEFLQKWHIHAIWK